MLCYVYCICFIAYIHRYIHSKRFLFKHAAYISIEARPVRYQPEAGAMGGRRGCGYVSQAARSEGGKAGCLGGSEWQQLGHGYEEILSFSRKCILNWGHFPLPRWFTTWPNWLVEKECGDLRLVICPLADLHVTKAGFCCDPELQLCDLFVAKYRWQLLRGSSTIYFLRGCQIFR